MRFKSRRVFDLESKDPKRSNATKALAPANEVPTAYILDFNYFSFMDFEHCKCRSSKKLWSSPEHPARSASFPEKKCELLTSNLRWWDAGPRWESELVSLAHFHRGCTQKYRQRTTYFYLLLQCYLCYCRCSFIACWVSRSFFTKKTSDSLPLQISSPSILDIARGSQFSAVEPTVIRIAGKAAPWREVGHHCPGWVSLTPHGLHQVDPNMRHTKVGVA